jgi:hypothetical protein
MKAVTMTYLFILLATGHPAWGAETLKVGPGQKYDRPSAAIRAARDGDTIEIDTRGHYDGDVCLVRANRLTLRGVGEGRARIPAAGRHCEGKAIWVIRGNDTTVENIEFSGCRVPDANGAGIRQEGAGLTVRKCKFHDCENSILGGRKGTILIEHCEFSYCSLVANPGTHNLYVSADKLIYRFNYSHHAVLCNVVKTRAAENHILYNRLTAEADGGDSFVLDISNGGKTYVVGNILQKSPKANNRIFIAYGRERLKHAENELYVVNNTMVNNLGKGTFVEISNGYGHPVQSDFKALVRNNIFVGGGTVCNWPGAWLQSNYVGANPRFANPAVWDYRLLKGSPCIDQGMDPGRAGDVDLRPVFQYVHPHNGEKRPNDGKIDVGAFEYAR